MFLCTCHNNHDLTRLQGAGLSECTCNHNSVLTSTHGRLVARKEIQKVLSLHGDSPLNHCASFDSQFFLWISITFSRYGARFLWWRWKIWNTIVSENQSSTIFRFFNQRFLSYTFICYSRIRLYSGVMGIRNREANFCILRISARNPTRNHTIFFCWNFGFLLESAPRVEKIFPAIRNHKERKISYSEGIIIERDPESSYRRYCRSQYKRGTL